MIPVFYPKFWLNVDGAVIGRGLGSLEAFYDQSGRKWGDVARCGTTLSNHFPPVRVHDKQEICLTKTSTEWLYSSTSKIEHARAGRAAVFSALNGPRGRLKTLA